MRSKSSVRSVFRPGPMLAALLALSAAGAGLAAPGDPLSFTPIQGSFPADIAGFTQAGDERVDFRVIVGRRFVGVDVIQATPGTQYAIELAVQCSGQETKALNLIGNEPLSFRDDLLVRCPFFSRGVSLLGAVGILER